MLYVQATAVGLVVSLWLMWFCVFVRDGFCFGGAGFAVDWFSVLWLLSFVFTGLVLYLNLLGILFLRFVCML